MGNPLHLPVWDRKAGKLFQEYMDDHPSTYESRPRRSLTQWVESSRVYDWLIAAYQNSVWSRAVHSKTSDRHVRIPAGQIQILAAFFDREFRPGVRSLGFVLTNALNKLQSGAAP
jgi:hypothetical protein